MNATKPIPVRMSSDLVRRVQRAARSLGSSSSAIIRLSILTHLPQIESGVIRLPKIEASTVKRVALIAGIATSAVLLYTAQAPSSPDGTPEPSTIVADTE